MAKRSYLDTITRDGITYGRTSTGSLFIQSGRNVKSTTIGIPEQINGMPVIGVDERAFANSNVKNILLPKTVIAVDNYAFQNALNLKTVQFEAPRVAIGHSAFTGCFKLQRVVGNELQTISDCAFSQCKNLVEIDATFVGEVFTRTFGMCKRLTELSFADGIKIHDNAFYGCMSIHTLYFVKNVNLSEQIRKFVEKRKIVCLEDCPLTELAYNGADIQIKWE